MKTVFAIILSVIACLAAAPAWAEGALVIGCNSNGFIVWGYAFGYSLEVAKQKALQRCQHEAGVACNVESVELHGDGPWVALAFNPDPPATPQCGRYGYGYSVNKAKAESEALSGCRQHGGSNCAVAFVKRNHGIDHYVIVPRRPGNPPVGEHCGWLGEGRIDWSGACQRY